LYNNLTIIHLDCWAYLHWKGLCFVDENVIGKYLKWNDKGLYISSPGVEASINLLKDLIYHGKVRDKYKDKILSYAKKESDVFLTSIQKPFGIKTSSFILERAITGNWDVLEKKFIKLRLVLFFRSFMHPISQLIKFFYYFRAQIRRFFSSPHGIFIVLIGPDGAGKSTTANNLFESNIKKLFQQRYYFHGHFPYLPEMKKIAGFFKRNKKEVIRGNQSLRGETEAISKANHEHLRRNKIPHFVRNDRLEGTTRQNAGDTSRPLSLLRSMIYPLYYGFNYFLGHFFIWKEKARAGLIIFDRYFYDYYIQEQFINCPRWLLRLIERLIPKPDIIIYLKNTPEVIWNRKKELSMEEIKRQMLVCEEITKRYGKSSFIIETNSIEGTILSAQKIIVNKIRKI